MFLFREVDQTVIYLKNCKDRADISEQNACLNHSLVNESTPINLRYFYNRTTGIKKWPPPFGAGSLVYQWHWTLATEKVDMPGVLFKPNWYLWTRQRDRSTSATCLYPSRHTGNAKAHPCYVNKYTLQNPRNSWPRKKIMVYAEWWQWSRWRVLWRRLLQSVPGSFCATLLQIDDVT